MHIIHNSAINRERRDRQRQIDRQTHVVVVVVVAAAVVASAAEFT